MPPHSGNLMISAPVNAMQNEGKGISVEINNSVEKFTQIGFA
jgi:hypothetical protein